MLPSRAFATLFTAALAVVTVTAPGFAQDPARTATIYIGGFTSAGATEHGVFGVDRADALIDSVARLAGSATARGESILPANVVATASYYGDTPPPTYTATDIAELNAVTSQWSGGVPRYALIVAKYARDVMRRSGARQINLVSASFGSLIARWLIEKNVAGLSGDGSIARWLSIEGVLGGNWAASHDALLEIFGLFKPLSIDLVDMHYDWVSTFVHAPRMELDQPLLSRVLVGQMASTDDDVYDGALTTLMLSYKDYQPNDGVQAVGDAHFASSTSRSRLDGLPPTLGYFHSNHYSIQDNRAAWAQAATFMSQRRRVTVTMTSAQVTDIHEPHSIFFDLRPAEVVFESRVISPAVEKRWGIADPVCTIGKEGAIAPLRLYNFDGETQSLDQLIFDDLVLDEETQLKLELHAEEIDYDARYGVFEGVPPSNYDDMGSGELVVSTLAPDTYTFRAASWNCTIAVSVHDYPFAAPVSVPQEPVAAVRPRLSVGPNPHGASVRIAVEGMAATAGPVAGALEVFDLSGRRVRRIEGDPRSGMVWDGRDQSGAALPAGLYVHRVVTPLGTWEGKSLLVR